MNSDSDAKRALDLRLASGEITQEEYNEILEVLNSSPAQSSEIEVSQTSGPPQVATTPPAQQQTETPASTVRNQEINVGVQAVVTPAQSFVGSAVLTWALYYIGFYIIGFIVNLVYLGSAKNIYRQTGVNPSGRGCLQFIFFMHFWLPFILFVIAVVLFVGVGIGDSDVWQELKRSIGQELDRLLN